MVPGSYRLPASRQRVGSGLAASSRQRGALLAFSGLIAAGLLISISAASTEKLLPESLRPFRGRLAGAFGTTGIDLGGRGLIAVLLLMFVFYVIAVRSADYLPARTVVACIVTLHALVLVAPPLLSTDVFSYQLYGRIALLHGSNPYLTLPDAFSQDPVYPYIGTSWTHTPSVYGPLFTALSYFLAPLSITASTFSYKAVAAIASLVTVALVWKAARLRGLNPVKAAALVGLNPLVVVYGVGGGHNDLMMSCALIAGVYMLLQRRERAGGGLAAVAVGIKMSAVILLPFALAAEGRGRGRKGRLDALVGAGIAAAALGGVALVVFGTAPLRSLSTLTRLQSIDNSESIPGFVASRVGLSASGRVVDTLLTGIFLVTTCWLLRRVWRGEMDWVDGTGWAIGVLLLTARFVAPWYVVWLLPFAALSSDRRLEETALWITGVVQVILLFSYLPPGQSML